MNLDSCFVVQTQKGDRRFFHFLSFLATWQFISPLLQQYQSAIRAHKAGKDVNFDELPVPPGQLIFFPLFAKHLYCVSNFT